MRALHSSRDIYLAGVVVTDAQLAEPRFGREKPATVRGRWSGFSDCPDEAVTPVILLVGAAPPYGCAYACVGVCACSC